MSLEPDKGSTSDQDSTFKLTDWRASELKHPLVIVLIIVFICTVIIGLVSNLNNAATVRFAATTLSVTGIANNSVHPVVVADSIAPPVDAPTGTIVLYKASMVQRYVDPTIGIVGKGGRMRYFTIPSDAIQVATYHKKVSATFTFENDNVNPGQSSQDFIYRNLVNLQLNITWPLANQLDTNG